MGFRNRSLALVACLSMVVAACGSSSGSSSTLPSTSSSTTSTVPTTNTTVIQTTTTSTTAIAGTVVDWTDSSKRFELGGGWISYACIGDALQLCIEKDGETIGVVDVSSYSFEQSEDPLMDFAMGFIEVFREDRAIGCGADYKFDPIGPSPFLLAGAPALSYGFEGNFADGSPSEYNLHYATIQDGRILSVTAIAEEDTGCLGRDDLSSFRPGQLKEFRPYLEKILEVTPLPVVEVGP